LPGIGKIEGGYRMQRDEMITKMGQMGYIVNDMDRRV
jgi:hypothetical protein